jgi:SAM-dependent methyltransferase
MSRPYEMYGLDVGDQWEGYCPPHEGRTTFDVTSVWLRDGLICGQCGSIPRVRAISHVIDLVVPDWPRKSIWEMAPFGAASDRLRERGEDYTQSHFWPEVPLGTYQGDVRCEDVERLTFDDESFDLVVSQDVFEHVMEVARVLRPGGLHIFTVPRKRELLTSRPRAVRPNLEIIHLEEPEYHGNPVDPSGSLVTFDWGLDLERFIGASAPFETLSYRVESFHLGLLGEFLEVFVSRKIA